MKRNLLKGIVLISTIAVLNSCSSTQKIASSDVLSDDDVYYTKAKAGDVIDYADAGYQNNDENYYDDYYYYGDYASRINRFGYFSPFNYWNNFNYGWGFAPGSAYGPGFSGRWFSPWGWGWRSPYSPYYGGFGWGSGFGYGGGWGSPWGFGGPWGGGMYAGLGFGYGGWYGSPWFDGFYDPFFYGGWGGPWGYGGGWGYGGWGYGPGFYGGWGFGGWGYGGGIGIGNYRQTPRPGYAYGQQGRPGAYGYSNGDRNGISPGRRPSSTNGTQTNGINPGSRAVRPARDEVSRPSIQTQSTQGMGSSGARGGGSSSGGSSGGGGGRPVRP